MITMIIVFSVGLCLLVWVAVKQIMFDKFYEEVKSYVEGYRRRCVGNNRFVVSLETLQDVFREYDTETIRKAWLRLIEDRIIEEDPVDGEWCIKRRISI